MCGGGVGLFMFVKTSGVLLISEDKSCIWGSPYFDQYGEEVRLPTRHSQSSTHSTFAGRSLEEGRQSVPGQIRVSAAQPALCGAPS